MDELINILEKEILQNNKYISVVDNINDIRESLMNLLQDNNLMYISNENYKEIFESSKIDYHFDENELRFFHEMINLDNKMKKFIVEEIGLNEEQNLIINGIKEKIKKSIDSFDEKKSEDLKEKNDIYKKLLVKLKNNGLSFINEFELIKELLNKYSVPVGKQILIYETINSFNLKTRDKFKSDPEKVISESELEDTNLDKESVSLIFGDYGIDFNAIPGELANKLLKHGNIDKIEELLEFIIKNENGLKFVLEKYDVLTKILLYSNVEILESIIKIQKENGIDGIATKLPTILFPPVYEKRSYYMKKKSKEKTTHEAEITGSYYNFKHNVEILNELNIPASVVYEKCSTFFSHSYKNVKKVIHNLALYGISAINEQDFSRTPFTVFRTTDLLLKNLDCAIESGCFEYAKGNLSRLINNTNIYNRVKLAYKLSKLNNVEFKPYRTLKNESSKLFLTNEFICDVNNIFGVTVQDTYEMYQAEKFNFSNKELYDKIIENSDNDSISPISIEDEFIKKLDSLFYSEEMPYIYNFNGVVISRNKVLRLYETLISDSNIKPDEELLLYVITYDSMLDKNEMENIENCIKKIDLGAMVKC